MLRKIFKKTLCFILTFIAIYGRASYRGESSSLPTPHNVILITITALRADHLQTYGYKRNTAPNIDLLAQDGVVFEEAITQSNWTLPSLASLLTSKYVHSHGIYGRNNKLSEKEVSLPEILKLYEYRTAAFVGGLDTVATYGLNQGFDYYRDNTSGTPTGSFKEIVPEAINWLRKNKDKNFFIFIQGYDVHAPYHQPPPDENLYNPDYNGVLKNRDLDYALLKNISRDTLLFDGEKIKLTGEDINYIIAQYDAGIHYADNFVGTLLNEAKKLNLLETTIIIITSEHGEELLDHGSFDRFGQKNLYEEVVHVPLIIKHPAIKGKRINNQVQSIDIVPTILDFLGIPINNEAQGKSLIPLIKGEKITPADNFNQYVFSEAGPDKWFIRTAEWKLIYDGEKYELYNLKEDIDEKKELSRQEPDIVYQLTQKLLEWRKETKSTRSPDDTSLELTEEMKNKLRKAGYWDN